MTYNLARAFELRNFWLGPPAKNVFWYRAESQEWIGTVERVGRLLALAKAAQDAAAADELAMRTRIFDRSEKLGQLMLQDVQAAIEGRRAAPERWYLGAGPNPAEVKAEAEGAIKDTAIMAIPYKGLVRRMMRIAHNVEVLDILMDTRLYLPANVIRENVVEMVFKGVWNPETRELFQRIYKAFVLDRLWSPRGRGKQTEWDTIITDARTVSDERGRVFWQVVEQSLQYTGTTA